MKRNPLSSPILVLALLALAGVIAGCVNTDQPTAPPRVDAEAFDSGDLSNSGPTSVFVHTFTSMGSFNYRCRYHSSMTGVVHVVAGGADSATVPITDFAFGTPSSPPSVKPYGYVKWVNGASVHTVTRP